MTDLERIAEQRAFQSLTDLADACRLAQDEWLCSMKCFTRKQHQEQKAKRAKELLQQYINEVETYLRNHR